MRLLSHDASCEAILIHATASFVLRTVSTEVDAAADGTEALGMIKSKKYGLVISDWNMEPITVYELLKEVRGKRVRGPQGRAPRGIDSAWADPL